MGDQNKTHVFISLRAKKNYESKIKTEDRGSMTWEKGQRKHHARGHGESAVNNPLKNYAVSPSKTIF